jgi:hypothetical protein
MKVKEIRKPRAYKMAEKHYQKALQRGVKEKKPLATMLEKVAYLYGQGADVVFFPLTNEIRVFSKSNKPSKK